jgi:arylsulfatase A-like enzyme
MTGTTRRSFLKNCAGTLAAAALSPRISGFPAQQTADTPNILLILVDDLGFGDLSSYGARDLQTPHIDGLVSSGMKFDSFYANCPVCSPTRAALLTGRYPDLVGVPGVIRTSPSDNFGWLDPSARLLPSLLKTTGYETAMVGKWHLGLEAPNLPNEHGFDYFYGFLGDMMDDYHTHRRAGFNYMRRNGETIDPEGHATDLFSSAAADYLRRNHNRPFFLYLAYNAPHTPIQPPDQWLSRIRRRQPGLSGKRAALAALIEHLDDGIGRVLAALDSAGHGRDTLIFFTSDNGGQLGVGASNGPLNGGKGTMLEGGIRVPMCAVWPGRIKRGSLSRRTALTMDLFPTICRAAGVDPPSFIEGRSILTTLKGGKQPEEDRCLFWVRREGGGHGGRAFYAARRGAFKLLQNSPFEPMRLYNLDEDPGETSPLGGDHKMYGELSKALKDHIILSGRVPWQKPGGFSED